MYIRIALILQQKLWNIEDLQRTRSFPYRKWGFGPSNVGFVDTNEYACTSAIGARISSSYFTSQTMFSNSNFFVRHPILAMPHPVVKVSNPARQVVEVGSTSCL